MSFKLRSANTIISQMIARMTALAPQITDYTEGAIIRSIIESVADELQQLDEAVYSGLREAITSGSYKAFGFSRKPATYALGIERFTAVASIVSPVDIPIGTTVQVPGSNIIYATTVHGVINPLPAPPYIDLPIQAQTVGAAGNTPANTIKQLTSGLSNIDNVTNQAPLINGQDQESEQQRFNRFQAFIAGLSQGTLPAIRALAERTYLADVNGFITEGVQNALVQEPYLSGSGFLGLVVVYIDNGTGTASGTLIAAVVQNLQGYTDMGGNEHLGTIGAGIDVQVLAVVPDILDLHVQISLLLGADATSTPLAVQAAIADYLQQLQVDDEAILTQIEAAGINAGGVSDIRILDVRNNLLTGNVIPPNGYRVVPGAITVTVTTF